MKSIDKILQAYRNEFQNNKGKGYIRLQQQIEYTEVILNFLVNILNKRNDGKILIIVDEYDKRTSIINHIKYRCQAENANSDIILNHVTILTEKYVNLLSVVGKYLLIITVDCYDTDVIKTLSANKFGLSIYNNLDYSTKIKPKKWENVEATVKALLPELSAKVSQATLMTERIYQPVEEYRIGVALNDDNQELYNKYEIFIRDGMTIFNDIETINKCRIGDVKNGISAIDFRYNLAIANGWSTELDCSIEYNREIDNCFNPNAIAEKAENILNIIRLRRNIVSNSEEKLEYIKNIVSENIGKKILIVSKDGEYAKKVKEYLNKDFDKPICGEYHDCIDDSYFVDATGETITYKSGANKGKPKVFKSQAISTMWEETYNKNDVNILSIKESSNTALNVCAEVIIFTSSLLKNIFDFKARFNNVKFIADVTKTYRLYNVETIEEKQFFKENSNELITICSGNGQNLSFDSDFE